MKAIHDRTFMYNLRKRPINQANEDTETAKKSRSEQSGTQKETEKLADKVQSTNDPVESQHVLRPSKVLQSTTEDNQDLISAEPVAGPSRVLRSATKVNTSANNAKKPEAANVIPSHQLRGTLPESTVVAENTHFKLVIVKSEYNHTNRFHLEDHKYVMKCEQKNLSENPAKLVDLLQLLFDGIENVLKQLKEYYKNPTHEYQVYTTVLEGHCKSGTVKKTS
jgi:hypothetical protein